MIDTLGIAGVGLIGGSIAAAAKKRGVSRVIGFGRSPERLEAAVRAGLIDEIATDYRPARDLDLFVSCLPVDLIAESVREASYHMRPGSVATDAGSAKGSICAEIGPGSKDEVTFVGSHPLAGSEKQGFEYADADLFRDRTCVMTPTGAEEPDAVSLVAEFWRTLGCRVVSMSAEEHDRILARTSHLPHVASAAVALGLRPHEEEYAAGGFRDVTRVAGGDPDLWASILLANREAVGDEIERHVRDCLDVAAALSEGDADQLREFLAAAKARRDAFARFFEKT